MQTIKILEHKTEYINNTDCLLKFQKYIERKNLNNVLSINLNSITAYHQVGVVKYKNLQIEILPKLVSIKGNENLTPEKEQIILNNLIFMLSYTKNLNIKTTDYSKLSKSRNPFLEILIREYAQSLFECLTRLTPKNYILEEDNLKFLKGKLKFSDNIKYNNSNKVKFYCEYDEYSDNNILNRLFLYVSVCLYSISRNAKNKKILKLIIDYYNNIEFVKFDKFMVKKINLNKNQLMFKKSFDLAKLFVEKSSVDLSKNKIENLSLIWDMNKLFEEFIAKLSSQINKTNIKIQKKRKLLKDDYSKKRDTYIDIFDTKSKKVLDTKYKHVETINDVLNADIYQVSTYCLLHNSDQAILLYPQGENGIDRNFDLNTTNNKKTIRFKTIDITQNLKDKQVLENLKQQLSDLF